MHGSLYVCAGVYRCMHVFYVCVDKRSLIKILGGASYASTSVLVQIK